MAAPFITQADVVNHLGRGDITDPGFTIAVAAACDIVRARTEQPITEVVGGTVVLDGSGTDALLLPRLPVNTVGTVTVDGTAVTDYVLRGDGALIRTTGLGEVAWPEGRQNVEVVCDTGYAVKDIPNDLKMVALAIAARIVVQGPLIQENIGQSGVRYATSSTDLTNGEVAILRKYRRAR